MSISFEQLEEGMFALILLEPETGYVVTLDGNRFPSEDGQATNDCRFIFARGCPVGKTSGC